MRRPEIHKPKQGLDREALGQDVNKQAWRSTLEQFDQKNLVPFLFVGLVWAAKSALERKFKGKDKKEELDKLKNQVNKEERDEVAEVRKKTTQELRFEALAQERGEDVASYARMIHKNYATFLELGQKYNSEVHVGKRVMKNSCVGFLMLALKDLPFKIPKRAQAGINSGKKISGYFWGEGRDGTNNYIPDVVGGDRDMYHQFEKPDYRTIESEVAPHLAVGEYAIASLELHHAFMVYKDFDGTIKMVHSGRNIEETFDEEGEKVGRDVSRVNETTLSRYIQHTKAAKGRRLTILPLSKLVEVDKRMQKDKSNREANV